MIVKRNIPVITIDGPSGSGKGTISRLLAKKLGWNFLDSGALYRVLAIAAIKRGVAVEDESALIALAQNMDLKFVSTADLDLQIILDGEDVTDAIRSEKCSIAASKVAALARVREALLRRQRDFRKAPGLVADGRDMGTVVFPQANIKIYLTASAKERAKRRFQQLQKQGFKVALQDVLEDLYKRDARDTQRAAAPLKPAADAILLDTSSLSVAKTMELVMAQVKAKIELSI